MNKSILIVLLILSILVISGCEMIDSTNNSPSEPQLSSGIALPFCDGVIICYSPGPDPNVAVTHLIPCGNINGFCAAVCPPNSWNNMQDGGCYDRRWNPNMPYFND